MAIKDNKFVLYFLLLLYVIEFPVQKPEIEVVCAENVSLEECYHPVWEPDDVLEWENRAMQDLLLHGYEDYQIWEIIQITRPLNSF